MSNGAPLVALALMLASVQAVAWHPDERGSRFMVSSSVEHEFDDHCSDTLEHPDCPFRIPGGLIVVRCDDDSPNWLWLPNIGGVIFCAIPRETPVELEFTHLIGAPQAVGRVTCPQTGPDDIAWHIEFAKLTNDEPVRATVPAGCDDETTPSHPDVTTVGVFVFAADTLGPGAYAQVQGAVSMKIL